MRFEAIPGCIQMRNVQVVGRDSLKEILGQISQSEITRSRLMCVYACAERAW